MTTGGVERKRAIDAQRKAAIVDVVDQFWDEHRYGPTRLDIARAIDLATGTVSRYVKQLIEENVLTEEPDVPRTLRLWG